MEYSVNPEENPVPVNQEMPLVYPPKFQKQEQPANVWMRSIISLALYLVLGYYIFHSFTMLLIITAIVMFHELGHFFCHEILPI